MVKKAEKRTRGRCWRKQKEEKEKTDEKKRRKQREKERNNENEVSREGGRFCVSIFVGEALKFWKAAYRKGSGISSHFSGSARGLGGGEGRVRSLCAFAVASFSSFFSSFVSLYSNSSCFHSCHCSFSFLFHNLISFYQLQLLFYIEILIDFQLLHWLQISSLSKLAKILSYLT